MLDGGHNYVPITLLSVMCDSLCQTQVKIDVSFHLEGILHRVAYGLTTSNYSPLEFS